MQEDLVLVPESVKDHEAYERRREGIETRGLKVNLKTTKVMVTGKGNNHIIQSRS